MHKRIAPFLVSAAFLFGIVPQVKANEIVEPLILQMADGSFYAPASGAKAATRQEILVQLGLAPALPPAGEVAGISIDVTASVPIDQQKVMDAITRGKALLREVIGDASRQARFQASLEKDATWREITLAVWTKETDQITTYTLQKNGALLKPIEDGEDIFDITVRRSNGLNSEFVFNREGTNVVVAIRYPIVRTTGKGATKTTSVEEVVYTPYSSSLHTPEMVKEGERVMDTHIKNALDALKAANVRSRAYPNVAVVDLADPELTKLIALIEHTDKHLLDKDPKKMIETMLVTVAVNPNDAYAYSRSSAGATGIMQFMPATYAKLASRPEHGLEKDFIKGTTNVANAIKAEIIFVDQLRAELMPTLKKHKLDDDEAKIREMLVAAYNGGGPRVRGAIPTWDSQIDKGGLSFEQVKAEHKRLFNEQKSLEKQVKAETNATKKAALKKKLAAVTAEELRLHALEDSWKKGGLRAETRDYIRKFRVARAEYEKIQASGLAQANDAGQVVVLPNTVAAE